MGISVTIANEKAMSLKNSPFRSTEALQQYSNIDAVKNKLGTEGAVIFLKYLTEITTLIIGT